MDKDQVLAERRLWMERDGVAGQQEVVLQIGIPQWSKGGDEAACPIAIKGLYGDLPPARGRDFIGALAEAARTLRHHCRKPPEGVQLFYFCAPSDDREPYRGEPLSPEERAAKRKAWDDLHRKDWDVLVERKILMQEDGSNERREVVLQIGHPYWMADSKTTTCPIALKGAGEEEIDHGYGHDLFGALCTAVREINERFEGPQCGRFFFWPDGEPYGGDYGYLPPRRYERDPRSASGNYQVLAERTLLMERDGDPKRRSVVIRIGHPYWTVEGEQASCPIEIVGRYGNVGPMHGDDLYTALLFALEFFDQLREGDPETRYFWPDGTPYEGEPLDREPESRA